MSENKIQCWCGAETLSVDGEVRCLDNLWHVVSKDSVTSYDLAVLKHTLAAAQDRDIVARREFRTENDRVEAAMRRRDEASKEIVAASVALRDARLAYEQAIAKK